MFWHNKAALGIATTLVLAASAPSYATCYLADPADVQLDICSSHKSVCFTKPAVYGSCGKTTLTGAVVESNGVAVYEPLNKTCAVLDLGTHTIAWTLKDKWGNVLDVEYAYAKLDPGIYGAYDVKVNDRGSIWDGVLVSGGATEIGADSSSRNLMSNGDVWLRSRALVDGFLSTGGVVDIQDVATITGVLTENLGTFVPWFDLATVDPLAPGVDEIIVSSGDYLELLPGQYGSVIVNSGGELVLFDGEYGMTSFTVNSGATLTHGSGTEIFLSEDFTFRGVQTNFLGLTVELTGDGTAAVEDDFFGYITAPEGTVKLASGGYSYTGRFRGGYLEAMEDSDVYCIEY